MNKVRFDDGSTFQLTGFAGGAHPEGEFATVTCEHKDAEGRVTVMTYKLAESVRINPGEVFKRGRPL